MPKLLIEGRTVDFETMPTEEEIDEVGLSMRSAPRPKDNKAGVQSNSTMIERQNLAGQSFNVPSATNRAAMRAAPMLKLAGPVAGPIALSGIFGEEVKRQVSEAALNPSQVPTFQEEEFGRAVDKGKKGIGLYPATVKGTIEDIWSDPAGALIDVLTAGGGRALKAGALAKQGAKSSAKITKAIKPSTVGKVFRSSIDKYKNKLALALDSVLDNADNLQYADEVGGDVRKGIPKNLDEFSSAIEQTKSKIFQEYNQLLQQAGGVGAKVDLTPIADELLKVADKSEIKTLYPQVSNQALEIADRLLQQGSFSVQEADDAIKAMNNSLKSFYKNGVPLPGTNVELDALIKNRLSTSLDDVIEKTLGTANKEFQQLKNRYGALRSIEPDVNRQLMTNLKKPNKGLADVTDVFTAADVIAGITGNSPILVTRGIVGQFIKGMTKRAVDPNLAVKNAFSAMEKIKEGKFAVPLRKIRITGAVTPQAVRQSKEK